MLLVNAAFHYYIHIIVSRMLVVTVCEFAKIARRRINYKPVPSPAAKHQNLAKQIFGLTQKDICAELIYIMQAIVSLIQTYVILIPIVVVRLVTSPQCLVNRHPRHVPYPINISHCRNKLASTNPHCSPRVWR